MINTGILKSEEIWFIQEPGLKVPEDRGPNVRLIETYAKDNEGESKKLRLDKSKMGRGQHRRRRK